MRFDLLFSIFRSRLWLILAVLGTTTLMALAASLAMTRVYKATTTIYVDVNTVDQVSGNATYTRESVRNNLATQIEIIKSDQVVDRVINTLKLGQDPDIQVEWLKATEGRGQLIEWLGPQLLRNLTATPSIEGTTITLSIERPSAAQAANMANAFANAYKDAALELKTRPAQEYAERFDEQRQKYRAAVEAAETKLSAFQRESGIVTADERLDFENQRLQELSSQLVQVQAQLADSRSRSAAARGAGDQEIPEVVQSVLLQTLTSELSKAEAKAGQLSAQYGENHPARLAAVQEVQELRTRIRTETARVRASVQTSNTINVSRERELSAAVAAQKAKVLALRGKRDQLAVFQREVDAARSAYDLANKRLTETTVGLSAGLSNISILSPATVPLLPSKPNILLNTVVALFLGTVLGMLAAFTLELLQKPLRSAEDLLRTAGVPVLAVLPPSSSTKAQRLIGGTGPTVAPPALPMG